MKGRNSLSGPLADPAGDAGYTVDHPDRVGFFTDTSVCIGCKACEVACKEWNAVPDDGMNWLGSSYDNSGSLGASTWRHVSAPRLPVLSLEVPRRFSPLSGTSFHSLHATSQALQPMQMDVSVKNPTRGGGSV